MVDDVSKNDNPLDNSDYTKPKSLRPTIEVYGGELDHLSAEDLIAMGIKDKQDGVIHSSNPISDMIWSEKYVDSLSFIEDNWNKGWWGEHNRIIKKNNADRLVSFKADMPNLGDVGYIEYDSNEGEYFYCEAVFIGKDNDALVISYIGGDRDGEHSLMGRGTSTMGIWHKTNPNEQ